MIFKSLVKKICSVVAAGTIGIAIIFSTVAPSNVLAATPTRAEQEFNEYYSSHSLKELNSTPEGQKVLYNLIREKYGVSNDQNKNVRLKSMMTELTNAVAKIDPTINDLPYVYFVNKDTSFNAFCSYAHVMSVNSGAFDLVANDDELAAIIGHEMGHGQKNHTYKVRKSAEQKVLWANIAAIAIGGGQLANIAGSILLNQSIVHESKSKEKEADSLAFSYMLNTNYNPGACAAIWQRVIEKFESTGEQSKVELFFNPSDHPNHLARRDKYATTLYEYSGKHVMVKDGELIINKENFIKPAAADGMSGEERSYFILGNLAIAYHNGQDKELAHVSNGKVYLGNQEIMTPAFNDESAQTIVDRLNSIK